MSSARVLIVEDEVLIALDIGQTLTTAGYEVVATVTSAEEALNAVAEHHPDLVLMDIRLSGEMDGIEAATQIYNRFNLPIIFLTASTDAITLERARSLPPFDFVLKPFDDEELIATIEKTIANKNTES